MRKRSRKRCLRSITPSLPRLSCLLSYRVNPNPARRYSKKFATHTLRVTQRNASQGLWFLPPRRPRGNCPGKFWGQASQEKGCPSERIAPDFTQAVRKYKLNATASGQASGMRRALTKTLFPYETG
jgi:hypothetical protein